MRGLTRVDSTEPRAVEVRFAISGDRANQARAERPYDFHLSLRDCARRGRTHNLWLRRPELCHKNKLASPTSADASFLVLMMLVILYKAPLRH